MAILFRCICVLVVFVLVSGRSHPNRLLCKDEYSYKDCKFYRDLGYCETHASTLHVTCPVACGLCDYGVDKKKQCEDLDNVFNCNYLKENGVCTTHPDIMAERCGKTCELCVAKEKCNSIKCPHYQVCVLDNRGEPSCECPKYCPYKEQYKDLGKVCASNQKTYKDFCHLQHHACRENKDLRVLFYGNCYDYDVCEDGKQEGQGACISWKKMGFCAKKVYDHIMMKYCKKTCGFCKIGKIFDERSIQNCTSTKFGCCWDGKSAPDPKYGSCRTCQDKYPAFCPKFMKQCNSENKQNLRFMKENCPSTCGYCRPQNSRSIQIQIFNDSGERYFRTQFKN